MATSRQACIKNYFIPSKKPKVDLSTAEAGYSSPPSTELNSSDSDSSSEEEEERTSDHGASDSELELSSEKEDTSSRDTGECTSECCNSDINEPYQPVFDYALTRKKQGRQTRSFLSSWFREHKWLSFCVTRKKALCFYCHKAFSKGLITFSKKGDSTFVTKGFDNWKKAKERFSAHEKTQIHNEAYLKCNSLQHSSVATQLASQMMSDQQQRREMLVKELSSLKFLMRQGLALRGHKEEEGNLYQLLKCRGEDVNGLEKWLQDGRYLSHDIINELIELVAHKLLRQLLDEIREVQWYSIIGDETRDASGVEQFGVSVRWIDTDYIVYEDLIALAEVEQTDAATLSKMLKDVILSCNLQLSNCRGQAYDGASNMSGHLNGVATRIQGEVPQAHYVHCLAHSLNLCLQDCGCNCRTIRESLALTTELTNLIRASPKRLAQFRYLQHQLAPEAPQLKPLCPTRWTVRTGAIDAIIKNYDVIRQELEQISDGTCGEASSRALGLLSLMDKFASFFGLRMSLLVFSASEQLSLTLQGHDIHAQQAMLAANAMKRYLQRQRSETSFNAFYQLVLQESQGLTQEPNLPRQRQLPRRIDQGAPSHQYASPQEYFRQQYFEVLDLLSCELTRRFDQPSLMVLQEMKNLLVKSCNGEAVQASTSF